MQFRQGRHREEPEINLIPLIDVLLVIIIFLMLTTTYAKFSGLEINLPTADSSQNPEQPQEVSVAVTASGQVLVNKSPLSTPDVPVIAEALRRAAGSQKDPVHRHQCGRQGHPPERGGRDAGGPERRLSPHLLRHPGAPEIRHGPRPATAEVLVSRRLAAPG